jgi:hypothetical protein
MREVEVVLEYCGEVIVARMKVRADYLATPHGKTQLKNILEGNARVLRLEETKS